MWATARRRLTTPNYFAGAYGRLRFNSTSTHASEDLRARLLSGVKTALKSKDAVTSTTLRSILSEVYSADKIAGTPVPSSAITGILRKAVARRQDAAVKFTQASRLDLAEKENNEVTIVSRFLPALLTVEQIDSALREVLETLPEGVNVKSKGLLLKGFYSKIEKSMVDGKLVNERVTQLLSQSK